MYVENARPGPAVQVGPNASVVGVARELTDEGMTVREDRFEEVILERGALVGAGAVVLPGVTVGVTVREDVAPGAVVRRDR